MGPMYFETPCIICWKNYCIQLFQNIFRNISLQPVYFMPKTKIPNFVPRSKLVSHENPRLRGASRIQDVSKNLQSFVLFDTQASGYLVFLCRHSFKYKTRSSLLNFGDLTAVSVFNMKTGPFTRRQVQIICFLIGLVIWFCCGEAQLF